MDLSDVLLADISRIAHNLNKNTLTEEEYIAAGGKFRVEDFEEYLGSFNGALALCGIKVVK